MAGRLLSLLLLLIGMQASAEEPLKIGVGDVVRISVYGEPELQVTLRVEENGKIRVPLIGDVTALGVTTDQLGNQVALALNDGWLVDPKVLVTIDKYRPLYIKGAVRAPGSYNYQLNITVERAIAIAGGLRDRASKDQWFVVRGEGSQPQKVAASFKLLPGDILTIQASLF